MRQWNRQERDALLSMGEDSPEYTKGVLSILGLYQVWETWHFALLDYEAARERLMQVWQSIGKEELRDVSFLDPPSPDERAAMDAVGLARTALDAAWKPIRALVDEAAAQRDSGEFW